MPKLSLATIKRYLLPPIVLAPLLYLLTREALFYFKSDHDRIAYCIDDIIANANHRQIGSMLDNISENYRDRFHTNKQALGKTLRGMWFRYKKVSVILRGKPKINIDHQHPDEASVAFRASVKLSVTPNDPGSDLLLRMRGTDRFYLKLKKERGNWKVISCAGKAE